MESFFLKHPVFYVKLPVCNDEAAVYSDGGEAELYSWNGCGVWAIGWDEEDISWIASADLPEK